MRSPLVRFFLLLPLLTVLFVSCASTNKGLSTVKKAFSPVTGLVKGTANRLKGTGSEMAGDMGSLTTKLPGTTKTNLTTRQRQAIADYERKKAYDQWVRKYNIDSNLIPKNAKVRIQK